MKMVMQSRQRKSDLVDNEPALVGGERTELEVRLRIRRPELERATFDRMVAIADPAAAPDPAYVAGLRAALAAAIEYGLAAFRDPCREEAVVPVQLLAQARLAARNGVSLEAVMRRYAAGHSLLVEAILDEAMALGIPVAELKVALRALAARYDRMVTAVSGEYERELAPEPRSAERRRSDLVRRLLAGEPLESSEVGYEFEMHHLAIVGFGPEARRALADLCQQLDRRLLLVSPEGDAVWAWLGGRCPFERDELDRITRYRWPAGSTVACGTAASGPIGWRLSHRQACAALAVARLRPKPFTHYSDVALCAAVLRDEDLVTYLSESFLAPLAAERGGDVLRDTLRAYYATGGNVSSAAALLRVTRQTVTARLRTVEQRLGLVLDSCRAEMEAALAIADLTEGCAP